MEVDETPAPKPRLRTPVRRTVKRAEPSGKSKRKLKAKQKQPPKPDLVGRYGKSEGDEAGPVAVGDVRGSSADDDLEILEVCRTFTTSHFFLCIFLFPSCGVLCPTRLTPV